MIADDGNIRKIWRYLIANPPHNLTWTPRHSPRNPLHLRPNDRTSWHLRSLVHTKAPAIGAGLGQLQAVVPQPRLVWVPRGDHFGESLRSVLALIWVGRGLGGEDRVVLSMSEARETITHVCCMGDGSWKVGDWIWVWWILWKWKNLLSIRLGWKRMKLSEYVCVLSSFLYP